MPNRTPGRVLRPHPQPGRPKRRQAQPTFGVLRRHSGVNLFALSLPLSTLHTASPSRMSQTDVVRHLLEAGAPRMIDAKTPIVYGTPSSFVRLFRCTMVASGQAVSVASEGTRKRLEQAGAMTEETSFVCMQLAMVLHGGLMRSRYAHAASRPKGFLAGSRQRACPSARGDCRRHFLIAWASSPCDRFRGAVASHAAPVGLLPLSRPRPHAESRRSKEDMQTAPSWSKISTYND